MKICEGLEVSGTTITMSRELADNSCCPTDVQWAAAKLRERGVPYCYSMPRLRTFVFCPQVHQAAGYTTVIVEPVGEDVDDDLQDDDEQDVDDDDGQADDEDDEGDDEEEDDDDGGPARVVRLNPHPRRRQFGSVT